MRVLVTGHRGYIGVHLVDLLKAEGHHVSGVDLGLFEGCDFAPSIRADVESLKDFRSLTALDLDGIECVMHLAALSNDPMGELDPSATRAINADGSVQLARVAKEAGVPRFLFSSSCSIYGQGTKLDLDESDPPKLVSAYAESKIESERRIGELSDARFCPVFLRNATAFGYSPMLRLDLVANNLLACALARGDIRIMSDGTPWRPLIHCRDIARAFVAFLSAPAELVRNRSVNIGDNDENYQVRQVGDLVQALVPHASIVYTGEIGNDPRNYRVRFDLLRELLPAFQLQYSLRSGTEELHRALIDSRFTLADFESDKYFRIRLAKKRLPLITNASAKDERAQA